MTSHTLNRLCRSKGENSATISICGRRPRSRSNIQLWVPQADQFSKNIRFTTELFLWVETLGIPMEIPWNSHGFHMNLGRPILSAISKVFVEGTHSSAILG